MKLTIVSLGRNDLGRAVDLSSCPRFDFFEFA